MADQTITVKVSGPEKAVEKFIIIIDKNFPLVVKSKFLPNISPSGGVHVFIDINPFVTKKGS